MVAQSHVMPETMGHTTHSGKVRSDFSDVGDDFVLPHGDAERGKKLFKKHCAQCHSVYADNRTTQAGQSQIGPTLFNVYGRKSGESEIHAKVLMGGRAAGQVWNDAPLMNYMKNPRQLVHGNVQMNFRGIDDFQTRVDIVHYLKTLNDQNEEVAHPAEKPHSFFPFFPLNVIGHYWYGRK